MSERRAGTGATILTVERDPHVRTLMEHFLTEAGYTVEFVDDGSTALARAQELRPRLVITEILVPKLDGLRLCSELKQERSLHGTRVLVFSLLSATEQARAAGADAFVRKPLAETRLVNAIRTLLEHDDGAEQESREGA